MKHTLRFAQLALTMSMAAPLFAGGLWFEVGNPKAAGDFATVRVFGIEHIILTDPVLTGTAEGIVNHQRVSMALTFTKLAEGGFYAIRWERPREGTWALDIRLHEYSWPGSATRVKVRNLSPDLFAVGEDGVKPEVKVFVPHQDGLSPGRVDYELRVLAGEQIASR